MRALTLHPTSSEVAQAGLSKWDMCGGMPSNVKYNVRILEQLSQDCNKHKQPTFACIALVNPNPSKCTVSVAIDGSASVQAGIEQVPVQTIAHIFDKPVLAFRFMGKKDPALIVIPSRSYIGIWLKFTPPCTNLPELCITIL